MHLYVCNCVITGSSGCVNENPMKLYVFTLFALSAYTTQFCLFCEWLIIKPVFDNFQDISHPAALLNHSFWMASIFIVRAA